MEPIRVLHVIGTMNRGGAETLLMEIYRHIDRTKIQFEFLVISYDDGCGVFDEEIEVLGGKLNYFRTRFYKNPFKYYRELNEFFKNNNYYAAVHGHLYKMSGFAIRAAKKNGIPVAIAHSHIAFPHTSFLRKFSDLMGLSQIRRYTDFYFGCSEEALILLAGKKQTRQPQYILNNAIDCPKFKFDEDKRQKIRTELGITDNTLLIGCVARFTYQKNHELLIKIFDGVNKINKDCMLVMAGTGGRVRLIEDMIKERHLESKAILLGIREDIPDIMSACDVFLLPSRYEGLGIVYIEAQANGLPCVMTRDLVPAEADVGAGLVTRVGLDESPEVWAKAVIAAWEKGRLSPDIAQKAVVDAGYDINKVAEWLQEFYLTQHRIAEKT
jgi:glycosyltransferase involved in cell wall biosynthesis